MRVLIYTPFKTASHTLLELLETQLRIPTVRTHAFVNNLEFNTKTVTHIITMDREDSELWMLSRMFQDIDQPAYPYSFSKSREIILKATPEELLRHFENFDWHEYINDSTFFNDIKNHYHIVLQKGKYGTFCNENDVKVFYCSVEKFNASLDQFAEFLGLSLETIVQHIKDKNTSCEKWYSELYAKTKMLLLQNREKKNKILTLKN